jgi:hypothetical protein
MNNPQFRHFRDKASTKNVTEGVTLAVLIEDGKAKIGLSRCGNLDNFCKAVGRKIALDRAKSEKAKFHFVTAFDEIKNPERPEEVDWDKAMGTVLYQTALQNGNVETDITVHPEDRQRILWRLT